MRPVPSIDAVDVRFEQKLVLANCTLDIFGGITA